MDIFMRQLQNEILLVGNDKNVYDLRTAIEGTKKQRLISILHGTQYENSI